MRVGLLLCAHARLLAEQTSCSWRRAHAMTTAGSDEVTITDLEESDSNEESPKNEVVPPPYRPLTPITTDPKQYNERFGANCPLPDYSEIDLAHYVINEQGVLISLRRSQRTLSITRTEQPRSRSQSIRERTVRVSAPQSNYHVSLIARVLSLTVIIFYDLSVNTFLFLSQCEANAPDTAGLCC